jgi:hypothetical protein
MKTTNFVTLFAVVLVMLFVVGCPPDNNDWSATVKCGELESSLNGVHFIPNRGINVIRGI